MGENMKMGYGLAQCGIRIRIWLILVEDIGVKNGVIVWNGGGYGGWRWWRLNMKNIMGVWLGCWDSRFDERRIMKNGESLMTN